MLKLLFPHAAAIIEDAKEKTLVIADPHLGWEMSLQRRGIHAPSQSPKLLDKLLRLFAKYKPDRLLVLGDVKYTVVPAEPGEWREILGFFTQAKEHVAKVGVVRGNHDANLEPMLPEGVQMFPASGVVVGEVGLFHGHKWPSPELLGCKSLVMGHLHPVVVLRDPAGFKVTQQVWMKADCNAEELTRILLGKYRVKIQGSPAQTLFERYGVKARVKQIFMMPSFNDLLGGRPVNEAKAQKEAERDSLLGPVLRSEAVEIGNSEIYLLDGTYVGTLKQLRSFS
ncbi:MAG: metallophosphoesterase [Candidatus Bathyarchaeota archaeon]|nr:metallophosphoesterase [Candidatus Bathyarchaeota archaeon]